MADKEKIKKLWNNLYFVGIIFFIGSIVLLSVDDMFYPEIVSNAYQRCDSICIRENGTSPCDCKEVIDKSSTVPLWYIFTFMFLMVIGGAIILISCNIDNKIKKANKEKGN